MANAQITTSVTIINSGLIGYQGISLTDFTASTVSAIAAGSGVEIASAFFKFSTDETINASSWTAITTATTAYLTLTPSGTAGSQILSAAWSSSAPVWSTSKQGWYTSAGSNIRVVVSAYKGSETQYLDKRILLNKQDNSIGGVYGNDRSYVSSTNGSTYVIPDVGFISMLLFGNVSTGGNAHILQYYINSAWNTVQKADGAGVGNYLFFYSDGASFRIYTSTDGTTCTSYYKILDRPY